MTVADIWVGVWEKTPWENTSKLWEKTSKLWEKTPQKTKIELRCFTGAVSYFHRFIKAFEEIMAPLHELTEI